MRNEDNGVWKDEDRKVRKVSGIEKEGRKEEDTSEEKRTEKRWWREKISMRRGNGSLSFSNSRFPIPSFFLFSVTKLVVRVEEGQKRVSIFQKVNFLSFQSEEKRKSWNSKRKQNSDWKEFGRVENRKLYLSANFFLSCVRK